MCERTTGCRACTEIEAVCGSQLGHPPATDGTDLANGQGRASSWTLGPRRCGVFRTLDTSEDHPSIPNVSIQ